MAKYTNFYETIKEMNMRLAHTVVMYDKEPYYVLCATDHKGDGIFRLYLDPLGKGPTESSTGSVPYEWMDEPGMSRGQKMDEYLEKNKNTRIIRKMGNSPAFDKFRPFPLGMCNKNGRVYYVERSPTRHTSQGLTQSMMMVRSVSLVGGTEKVNPYEVSIFDNDFYDTMTGSYPSCQEVISELKNPEVINVGAAFHRNFAVMRGPLDTMYLAYKNEVVGQLVNQDTSEVRLGKAFVYTRECIEDLKIFNKISVM